VYSLTEISSFILSFSSSFPRPPAPLPPSPNLLFIQAVSCWALAFFGGDGFFFFWRLSLPSDPRQANPSNLPCCVLPPMCRVRVLPRTPNSIMECTHCPVSSPSESKHFRFPQGAPLFLPGSVTNPGFIVISAFFISFVLFRFFSQRPEPPFTGSSEPKFHSANSPVKLSPSLFCPELLAVLAPAFPIKRVARPRGALCVIVFLVTIVFQPPPEGLIFPLAC